MTNDDAHAHACRRRSSCGVSRRTMQHMPRSTCTIRRQRSSLLAGGQKNSSLSNLTGKSLDGQADSVKKYRICLSVVNLSAVRWLGKSLDSQTDSVKKYRICLSVVNLSAVRWLGTTFDSQTDSVKKYRIRLSVVNLSAVRWLGTTFDSQTDSVKKYRIRLSVVNLSAVRLLEKSLAARQIQSKSRIRLSFTYLSASSSPLIGVKGGIRYGHSEEV
jgi:hypothetical protein